jgi:glycosyltransferase involved in cell wall biosynthesis
MILVSKGSRFDEELSKVMFERDEPVEIIEVDQKHYSLGEQTKLLKLLNELKPDLVHFPHFNHPILYKGRFVVTIHDLTLSQFAERRGFLRRQFYKYVISHAAKKAEKILTVSEYVKRDLSREFSLAPDKIVVAYNGIDKRFKKITSPQALKKGEKYSLKKPYLLSVGQWRSHKNLPRLAEAFSQIVQDKKWASKIDLVFAGRIDPKYPQIVEKVKELGISDLVKFTGFVDDDDLPIIYNNALIFAFPSLSEGFGLPALEAQACGLPVVASDRTCLPEILGKGAVYFNPECVDEMAKKIKQVLEDEKLKDELIEKGQENTKRFSWKESAQKTLEVYREILYNKVI